MNNIKKLIKIKKEDQKSLDKFANDFRDFLGLLKVL